MYPIPEATLSSSNLDADKRSCINRDSQNIGTAAMYNYIYTRTYILNIVDVIFETHYIFLFQTNNLFMYISDVLSLLWEDVTNWRQAISVMLFRDVCNFSFVFWKIFVHVLDLYSLSYTFISGPANDGTAEGDAFQRKLEPKVYVEMKK